METEGNNIKHGTWIEDITELERLFQVAKLPSEPIRLDACSQITDISLFIDSHISFLKAQNGNKRYLPYLDRLNELKAILKSNLN